MQTNRSRLGRAVFAAAAALLPSVVRATTFTYTDNTVFDLNDVDGSGDPYNETDQVVVGNGGVVATIGGFNDGQFVTYTPRGGATQIVARTDTSPPGQQVFGKFSELSLTQGGGDKLTFVANDHSDNVGLFQATLSAGAMTPTTIEYDGDQNSLQTNPGNGGDVTSVHYTVNAAGQVAYQRLSPDDDTTQQIVRGQPNQFVISDGAVTNFNATASDNVYKRVQIADDGSIVFRATDSQSQQTGIYRSTNGTITSPIVSVSNAARVVSASDDRVLYTDVDSTDATLTDLNLTGVSKPLAQFSSSSPIPQNAVMTQQNRVAFYVPNNKTNAIASVGYYAGSGDKATTVATEGTSFTFDHQNYGIAQIDTTSERTGNPMVNDNGIVVFDATLTPEDTDHHAIGDAGSITALLAWRASSPNDLQIIIKASADNAYADTYTDAAGTMHQITLLPPMDEGVDQAGDVAKDQLSDDNWVAFGIDYDNDTGFAVLEEQLTVPEPTAVAVMGIGGAAMTLRRRRRTQ